MTVEEIKQKIADFENLTFKSGRMDAAIMPGRLYVQYRNEALEAKKDLIEAIKQYKEQK